MVGVIDAAELVPGDIALVEENERIAVADPDSQAHFRVC